MAIDGYQMLGNAVVYQAARDYRKALRALHFNPNDKKAKKEVHDIEESSSMAIESKSLQESMAYD